MSVVANLRDVYLEQQPRAAARSLEALSDDEIHSVLAGVDAEKLTAALELISIGRAQLLFRGLGREERTQVLTVASPRLALLLLNGVPEQDRDAVLEPLPSALRDDLERLRHFEEDSAGRLMDRPLDSIRVDMTVAETLEVLRRSDLKRLRSFYVVDEDNRLAGRVDMQAVALARPDDLMGEMLVPVEGAVPLTASRADVVAQLDRYRIDSVPVLDRENRLVGVVRYQRLFEAIESVAMADLQRMVGVSADERALSTAFYAVRRRLPWLHINLLTAFLAASVVGLFENLIAQFTALAVLLPVVAGQSGNAGSQALAVTIRGLALREIGTREWRRVLR